MRFVHINISAGNWKKLAEFYQQVFGCRPKPPQRKLSGDWLDQGTGLQNAALEGVHLIMPGYGSDGPTLEIFTYQDPLERKPGMPNHTGLSHLAFEVENVKAVANLALLHGGSMLGRVTKKAIEGVGVIEFVYLRDPEGNIIEVQSWKG